MSAKPSKNGKKTGGDGRYQPGNPGGPGRPAGSRNRASVMLDRMADDDAKAILQSQIEKAKEGDGKAAEMILARVWPVRRGRPLTLAKPLPAITTAGDIVAALGAVATLVGEGQLTAEEAAALAAIFETKRRAIETVAIEARLTALEQERK